MSSTINAIANALPNYQVDGELGRGSYGIVYAGRHLRLDRPVAIKEVPSWLVDDAEVRARFVTEARVLASLDHPHIVPVYDYVEQGGLCLLVMESLGGGTVWESFQQRGISSERACAITAATAAALHYAHENGVLHRDVKPENLLFSSTQHLKLTDFGIAKVVGGNDALVTTVGGVLGTPAYMAPEQAEGGELTPAVDVYAAGVMLYELLSGRLPFSEEGGGLAIVYRHVHDDPVRLEDVAPDVPKPLAEVVMRALSRSQTQRYATAEEFGVAIGEAASSSFGAGWLSRTGVLVLAAGRIQSSLEVPSAHEVRAPDLPGSLEPETIRVWGAPGGAGGSGPVAGIRQDVGVIRPRVTDHVGGASPDHEGSGSPGYESPVPVREVLDLPPRPWALSLLAIGMAVLVVVAAYLGWGSTTYSRSLPAAATVAVAGHNITNGGNVKLNVDNPIPVLIAGLSGAATASLKLTVIGAEIASSAASPLTATPGGLSGTLHLTTVLAAPRYLIPGKVDATLKLAGPSGAPAGSQQFTLSPTGVGFATVPGVVVVVLILFVGANLEALFRSLRRNGRWRKSSGIRLAIVGAEGGVTLVGLAWVLGRAAPEVNSLVICGLLGAATAILLGLASARNGQRSRARRIARQQGLLAGRR